MKLQEVEINKAQGMRLCEEMMINGDILPKNHILTKGDIINLKALGLKTIFGAVAETDDIDFDVALQIIAAKICGQNLGFRIDNRGFCEIVAVKDGILEISHERINKFNRLTEYFILNTISPLTQVKSRTIVARLEITTPILPQEIINSIVLSLSGNEALLKIKENKQQNAALLISRLFSDENELLQLNENEEKLSDICKKNNLKLKDKVQVSHNIEEVANGLEELLNTTADIIFIIPAIRGYYNDIIYRALCCITDNILCRQLPILGGSDVIIATKKNKKIISLPHNYMYLDAPILDECITLAIIKDKLQINDFKFHQNTLISDISKIKDISTLIRDTNTNDKAAAVAAIVLAAGQSKRIGKNKLLYDIEGKPLATKAIQAAIKSKASPVFVITGYQAEELEAELENFDINVIYNPNYRTGIKTSINLGINAVPDFCDGVLLIPADMPNITPQLLNKMIDKFKKKQTKALILTEKNGIKNNPVLWSKSLYNVADLAAENADIRPIFMEHADYTTTIKASAEELLDVNYQNDLDMLNK